MMRSTKLSALLAPFVVLALASGAACSSSGGSPSPPIAEGDGGGSTNPPGTEGGAAEDGATSEDASSPPVDCPAVGTADKKGTVTSGEIDEASGLAASTLNPGVLWTHNDSGDTARVFALRTDGSLVAELPITGATATDWEAMQVGPYEGAPALYIGDIGDNLSARANITIFAIPEPSLSPPPASLAVAKRMDVTYEDGPHNAETLLVDPLDGTVVVVTKVESGQSGIYVLDATKTKLEKKGALAFGAAPLTGDPLAVDGSISPDGSLIAIRTYTSAFLWRRGPGMSIPAALATAPCPLHITAEPQGEAITIATDKSGYFTFSEKKNQPLWFFTL